MPTPHVYSVRLCATHYLHHVCIAEHDVHNCRHHSLQDAVAVVGYPIGGDTISVTSGVVSRIEVTSYVHGSTELLGVQIDAAINSGNSGEHCPNAVNCWSAAAVSIITSRCCPCACHTEAFWVMVYMATHSSSLCQHCLGLAR